MQRILHHSGEQHMIDGCRKGDPKAQQCLYETFAPRMYTLCRRYLSDPMEAEDVLVVSFTRILDRIQQFRGEGSLEGWIRTIVVREALNALRRQKTIPCALSLEHVLREPSASATEATIDTEALLAIIHELPPGYKLVFNLYALDGYSHKEIAEHLGISENTSKSQLSRAREYLRRRLFDQKISYHWQNDGIEQES